MSANPKAGTVRRVLQRQIMPVDDLVGVHRGAGADRLAQRRLVELLGALVTADVVLVGIQYGGVRVDVQRDHVEVAVDGHDLTLQDAAYGP